MLTRRQVVFDTLIRLAEQQTDSAGKRLARLMQAATDDRGKLQILERYRVEYRNRMSVDIATGVDAMALQNFGQFLAKLDEAIRMQAGLVSQRENDVDRGRLLLNAARRKSRSYSTVAERLAEQRAEIDRRREQAQSDEVAQRRHRRTTEEG